MVAGIGGDVFVDENSRGWFACDCEVVNVRSCCSWWCRWRCRWLADALETSVGDSYFFGYFLLATDAFWSDQLCWNRGTLARFSCNRSNALTATASCEFASDFRFSSYVPSMTGMPLSPGDTDLDVLKWEINSYMQMRWNENDSFGMRVPCCVCMWCLWMCLWIHLFQFSMHSKR